ncbi:MAG: prolipoprotein diacylglyceryl transferase [Acidimicrobiia bacterium]|nr:prolipoprotein diacylglyceryl transferase [Acidimicrobiia bacterium]
MQFDLLVRAAMAVGAVWVMLRWEGRRGNATGCSVDLFDAILVSGAVGVLAGRIGAMVAVGINPITDPGQVLLVRTGVSASVAAITAIVVLAFLARTDIAGIADAAAPAIIFGLAGWHGSCVVDGSCGGTATDVAWAISLPGSTVGRHPVELYGAFLLTLVGVGLALWKQYGRPPRGTVAGVALTAVSGIRLATEPMRVSLIGGPMWLYGLGFVTGVGATLVAVLRRNRKSSVEARTQLVGPDRSEPRIDDDTADDDH